MKRDLDLMRQILFDAEASKASTFKSSGNDDSDDDTNKMEYHTYLLEDLGFVKRYSQEKYGNIYRITDSGNNFIMLSRNEETWENAKKEGLGIMSLIMELLIKWGNKNSEA